MNNNVLLIILDTVNVNLQIDDRWWPSSHNYILFHFLIALNYLKIVYL